MLLLASCLLASSPGAWAQVSATELMKIVPPNGQANAFFGARVAFDGNLGLVSAPLEDDVSINSGSARVFDVTTGQVLSQLTPSDPALAALFGESVALQGNLALVGTILSSPNGVLSAGSAHLFDATTGVELRVLLPQDPAPNDEFGAGVALAGNRAVVGANSDDGIALNAGAAYVFDVTTGNQLFKLTANDGQANDFFGLSVAAEGNLALIGALGDDDNGEHSGSAYLFDLTTGQQLLKLLPSDGAANLAFGQAVALSGNLALVGQPTLLGDGPGAAYLFDASTGQELRKLVPEAGSIPFFGTSVAIGGGHALVGSPADNFGQILNPSAGSAHLFDIDTGQEVELLVPSDTHSNMAFGNAVALSGTRALIGARTDNVNGDKSGSAYLFPIACTATNYCSATANSSGQPASIAASGTTSIAANDLELSVSQAAAQALGLFYHGPNQVQMPFGDGLRCVGGLTNRLAILQTDSSGFASFHLDLQAAANISANTTRHFQFWFRDPQGPGGTGYNLSDALSIGFCP